VKELLASAVRTLVNAETQVVLLARSHPINWLELKTRLTDSWNAGQPREPVFRFAAPPNLTRLRLALQDVEIWVEQQGPWGELLAARARELELEAELAEHIGDVHIRSLAARRFAVMEETSTVTLRQQAKRWSQIAVTDSTDEVVRSDDERDERSLLCLMRRELELCQYPFRIVLESRLASIAAVDNRFVWIRPGVLMRPIDARRIVLHEVHGHVVRRVATQWPEYSGYACGVAQAGEDEEGRALWLEEKEGLLDSRRKVELGRRHLAADACRQGANFCDGVELLLKLNTSIDQAIGIALRVWRGGGIAREIVYLDAFERARKILPDSPEIDDWMTRGRLSIDVSKKLASGTLQQLM
jgi:hypothetical protein